jgi:hypothetical protein
MEIDKAVTDNVAFQADQKIKNSSPKAKEES